MRRILFTLAAALILAGPASAQQLVSHLRVESCTNQVVVGVLATARISCAAVNLGNSVAGTLPVANGGTAASSASGAALDNITGFSSTGIIERTGSATYAFRSRSGTGTTVVSTTGSQTSGRCVEIDSDGNHIAAAAGCSSASGDVSGGSTSVDGELAAYNGTGGKTIKQSFVKFSGPTSTVRTYTVPNSDRTLLTDSDVGTSGAVLGRLNANKTDSGNNSFTGQNKFAEVRGSAGNSGSLITGTTYTTASADCGTQLVFTSSSAVTVTIASSIVPAFPEVCNIGIRQSGTGKVSVNGTAVTAATLVSDAGYTATSGTAGNYISLTLMTISGTAKAFLDGPGS